MIKKLIKRAKLHKLINDSENINCRETNYQREINISERVEDNFNKLYSIFKGSVDINIRKFSIGKQQKQAFIVNIEGISDINTINESILGTLMTDLRKIDLDYELTIDNIMQNALSVYNVVTLATLNETIDSVLSGNTVVFLDGENAALEIGTRAWEHRGVESPQTENAVRGPQEGFCETLRTNTALIRRKIKNQDLKMTHMKIGQRTRTDICIAYIDGLADSKVVEEVMRRLKSINIDAILESGYIEEFIEDSAISPFPTVGNTEKPDKLASKLLEGRVGILVDGSPIALTVPFLLIESLQASEDYYSKSYLSSLLRILRFISLHLTIYLPALYVSLAAFHPNIVPERLLVTMQVTREGIPFPAVIEALVLGIMFEVLREAGVRMPKAVGQAVSIAGALILGEVAVNAGLVSPLMVVVVASTGILGFLIPPQAGSVTLLRYPILIFASMFGLFGVIWSYIFIIIHLCSLSSFGSPYLSPVSPISFRGLKDFLIRVPWWMMQSRPQTIGWKDSKRISEKNAHNPVKYKGRL